MEPKKDIDKLISALRELGTENGKGNNGPIVLNDVDLHCISRIIQSALFARERGIFYGCKFCKYSWNCGEMSSHLGNTHFNIIRKKLQDATDVELLGYCNLDHPEVKFRGYKI